ncbi:Hsp20 family protein [Desulfoscipio gibsoniae]
MLDSNKFLTQLMNALNQSNANTPNGSNAAAVMQVKNKSLSSITREVQDEVIITLEVPGIQDRADINFAITVTKANIRGVRQIIKDAAQQGSGLAQERFEKTFVLPCPVRPETASASYSKGLLTLKLKKLNEKTFSNVLVNFYS